MEFSWIRTLIVAEPECNAILNCDTVRSKMFHIKSPDYSQVIYRVVNHVRSKGQHYKTYSHLDIFLTADKSRFIPLDYQ